MPIKYKKELKRTPNRMDQKRKSLQHVIIKIVHVHKKERILKPAREKAQVAYKGR